MVEFFGYTLSNSVLFSYVLAASFLLVSILSPILSGIADVSGNKKRFMQFFCYLGALSSISLFWFNPANIEWGDRKSTRLNSSHVRISYAVFCLKKKKKTI